MANRLLMSLAILLSRVGGHRTLYIRNLNRRNIRFSILVGLIFDNNRRKRRGAMIILEVFAWLMLMRAGHGLNLGLNMRCRLVLRVMLVIVRRYYVLTRSWSLYCERFDYTVVMVD